MGSSVFVKQGAVIPCEHNLTVAMKTDMLQRKKRCYNCTLPLKQIICNIFFLPAVSYHLLFCFCFICVSDITVLESAIGQIIQVNC